MNQFFDTSVLIAVFWGDHPHHARSLPLFVQAKRESSCCAAHSVAEVYSVLTRLPVRPAILPEQALLFLEQIEQRLTLVALHTSEYISAVREAGKRKITGGRIYDALLLRCARKAKAERIYTWNVTDFQRIAPDLASRIRMP